MRMFIPEIGTEIRLISDWTFDLFTDRRNETLFAYCGLDVGKIRKEKDLRTNRYPFTKLGSTQVTLSAGTVLIVDRIYIRKGAEDYSSVTFKYRDKVEIPTMNWRGSKRVPGTTKRQIRFWAKLNDVNQIEFELVEDSI